MLLSFLCVYVFVYVWRPPFLLAPLKIKGGEGHSDSPVCPSPLSTPLITTKIYYFFILHIFCFPLLISINILVTILDIVFSLFGQEQKVFSLG